MEVPLLLLFLDDYLFFILYTIISIRVAKQLWFYLLPYNFYVLRINLLYEADLINTVWAILCIAVMYTSLVLREACGSICYVAVRFRYSYKDIPQQEMQIRS